MTERTRCGHAVGVSLWRWAEHAARRSEFYPESSTQAPQDQRTGGTRTPAPLGSEDGTTRSSHRRCRNRCVVANHDTRSGHNARVRPALPRDRSTGTRAGHIRSGSRMPLDELRCGATVEVRVGNSDRGSRQQGRAREKGVSCGPGEGGERQDLRDPLQLREQVASPPEGERGGRWCELRQRAGTRYERECCRKKARANAHLWRARARLPSAVEVGSGAWGCGSARRACAP